MGCSETGDFGGHEPGTVSQGMSPRWERQQGGFGRGWGRGHLRNQRSSAAREREGHGCTLSAVGPIEQDEQTMLGAARGRHRAGGQWLRGWIGVRQVCAADGLRRRARRGWARAGLREALLDAGSPSDCGADRPSSFALSGAASPWPAASGGGHSSTVARLEPSAIASSCRNCSESSVQPSAATTSSRAPSSSSCCFSMSRTQMVSHGIALYTGSTTESAISVPPVHSTTEPGWCVSSGISGRFIEGPAMTDAATA
eukprot:scaffold10770_cov90-Isochrysis_galbana.AAC.1